MTETIEIETFHALAIHVGRVLTAEVNTRARHLAYVLRIDLGDELGVRTSSAQITGAYAPGSLVGRLVLALVNIPPRRVAGIKSGALVLGVYSDRGNGPVVLIGPDEHDQVRPGDRVG